MPPTRSRSDIALPSHWDGLEPLYIVAPSRARLAAPSRRIVQQQQQRQSKFWHPAHGPHIIQNLHEAHEMSEHQVEATAAASAALDASQQRRQSDEERRQSQRERFIRRRSANKQRELAATLTATQKRAAERHDGRVRVACEAPLHDEIVFLPSLPEAKQRAQSSWACDVAPPRSPWEELDVRRTVEQLNDDGALVLDVLGAMAKPSANKAFASKMRNHRERAMGRAPQPWHFRMDGPPSRG